MKQKVLFIGIGFYDYDVIIRQAIEKLGFEVDYFCETPKGFFYSFANYLKLNSISQIFRNNHSINIANACGNDYSYIFVIKGDCITHEALNIIQQKNKNAKTVLYLWDSIKRMPNYKNIQGFFMSIYSFDRVDCMNNKKIKFKPLFYRSEYKINNKQNNFIYDLFFIGWAHSDRAILLKEIDLKLQSQDLKSKFLIFVGKAAYYISKPIRAIRTMTIQKPISTKDIAQYCSESGAILDIAHPLQTGLTMRTIEVLFGIGRKLITTNKDIINYDFYNKNNILIINRDNLDIPKDFFKSNFIVYPDDLRDSFFIENWVKDFFDES
ncbi:hypothetical protein [Capnocytophaga granulosa]|uniref:hypothetical protein n=1 Tax=Capnocytophaga granulosa TaxID=45242 RepID=UPI0028E5E3ED|nr:hypothetical protein [Capnocytophaga granulosa]